MKNKLAGRALAGLAVYIRQTILQYVICLLEIQLLDIDIDNVYQVFAGDLNARTAALSDIIQYKNIVPDLDEYIEILSTFKNVQNRVSYIKIFYKF